MPNMVSFDAIGTSISSIRTVFVLDENCLPCIVPAGFILMNAARPLYGDKTLEGIFLSGRHYALIDLASEQALRAINHNVALDAYVVSVFTKDDLVRMALVDNPYASRIVEEYPELDDKWELLNTQINDFLRRPYGELLSLRKLAMVKAFEF